MIVRKYRSTDVYEVSDPIDNENMYDIARWCGGVPIRNLFGDWVVISLGGAAPLGQRILRDPHGKFRVISTLDGFEPLLSARGGSGYSREDETDGIKTFNREMKSQRRNRAQSNPE